MSAHLERLIDSSDRAFEACRYKLLIYLLLTFLNIAGITFLTIQLLINDELIPALRATYTDSSSKKKFTATL